MAIPGVGEQLVTVQGLATYGGLSTLVFAITNTVKVATGWNPRWLGLVISVCVCLIASFYGQPFQANAPPAQANTPAPPAQANAPAPPPEWPIQALLAIGNACIIYLAAQGATAAGSNVVAPAGGALDGAPPASRLRRVSREFFRPW